jgi:hypothetical protein
VRKQDTLFFWVLVAWSLAFLVMVIFLTPVLKDITAGY